MHAVTRKWLRTKPISPEELSRLLDCTHRHAADLMTGEVEPTARERAVIRLCVNVRNDHLRLVLDDMGRDYEWKTIPGYSRYEASSRGQVRRMAAGPGSLPGHVLRPKTGRRGYLYVNLTPDDRSARQRQVGIHQAVCLAFHGPAPSPQHVVCHEDDVPNHNGKDNLYWGTAVQNAQDKKRNALRRSGPLLHHGPLTGSGLTPMQIKKRTKETMRYRLEKMA